MPINVTMPALSPTMTEGNLAKWLVSEGDEVAAGDVIAEIETDKATMEVEAVDEGKIGKILVGEGTEGVAVNSPIAILLEEGESEEDLKDFDAGSESGSGSGDKKSQSKDQEKDQEKTSGSDSKNKTEQSGAADSAEKAKQPQAGPAPKDDKGGRIFASPLARRIAQQKGLDLSHVKGTGPHGRIVKADVEKAESQPQSQPSGAQAPGSAAGQTAPLAEGEMVNDYGQVYTELPLNNIKKITAKRLLEAKQTVPHFYLTIECQLDNLLEARKQLNAQADGEYKLSVNDFIIKANAMALQAYPPANTFWQNEKLIQFKHSDISVAVATPNGLITPIIKKAETKGLRAISDEMKELAGRARDGKLKPEEFQGGSFSISNLGMFGVKEFAAIINPPQSCIMAVGAGEQKTVVEDGEIKIRTIMNVTLSTDHRSVDGAVGAKYLQHFKRYIENPVAMLV